jgi:hypothetical protein
MEDKNKKPVDKQELKKPTGKSATGKPLDGIEIRPQLKDLGQGQRNEDAVVLADTLSEKKALTLVQRQRRARAIRAKEPKMQRAKELAKHKLASDEKLKARAIVQARNIVKKRFASRRGTPYTELSTAEKIQVDTAVDKKVNLIKKLATRLLPRIRKMEFDRLASFNSGAPLKNLAPAAVSEDLNKIIESLNNKSPLHLVDIINESIHTLNEQNDSMAITLKRMLHAVLPEDSTTFTIMKKAERTGIPFSTLREVFERGVFAWDDEKVTQEQYAFSRVNSYIAKGKAWTLDADLREVKDVNDKLDSVFEAYHTGLSASTAKAREAHWKKMEKYSDKDDRAYQDAPGDKAARKKPMPQSVHTKKYHAMYGEDVNESLWANIHAKRKRIKAGSGERMRKPGEKGAPTQAGLKSAQEAADLNNPANREVGTNSLTNIYKKDTPGQSVAVSKLNRNSHEFVDRGIFHKDSTKRHQEIKKKIIDESNNKPYVKPFTERGSTQQRGWKASNKHGNVKYFGKAFKASAHKHAGISEAAEKHPIVKEYEALKKHDIKTLRSMIARSGGVVDTSGFKSKDHAASHIIRSKHGNKKVDAAFGFKEDTTADREVGTKSLVKKYQKETLSHEKADINESFNIEFAAGIGVGLTANECGIYIKPGFEMHPDVVEEVRSADTRGEVVPGYTKIKVDPKTGQQKTINVQAHIARGKVRRKIIGSGNVHDGAA